jgi:hypothetical protein
MWWFFDATPPGEETAPLRGGATESEANATRAAHVSAFPDWTFGDVFEEADDYDRTRPRPLVRITRADGSVYEEWTDNSVREIS